MRQVLRWRARDLFTPGAHLLDFGCGTGLDTLFLAEHGFRVTAADVSPGMLALLRRRLADHPARAGIQVLATDTVSLCELPTARLDGIYSAFAGLNTTDPAAFADEAARVLRPGGRLLAHLLAPSGIWERRKARRLAGRQAAQELGRQRQRTMRIGGRLIHHWVLPPRESAERFAPWFTVRRLYALGFFWERDFGERIAPTVATTLGRLEARLGRIPALRGWGRFYVLEMERSR